MKRDPLPQDLADRWALPSTDRHFTKMLFCGAGPLTVAMVEHLHARLDEALRRLNGRQQPPHWQVQPTQEMLDAEEASVREADLVCEQVARDVAMALTGKDITFW